MDNGQMASWVARLEHLERIQVEKQDEQFWRDIQPDELDTQTHVAISSHAQTTGSLLFLKKCLASLSSKLKINRKSELPHPKAGYKQSHI